MWLRQVIHGVDEDPSAFVSASIVLSVGSGACRPPGLLVTIHSSYFPGHDACITCNVISLILQAIFLCTCKCINRLSLRCFVGISLVDWHRSRLFPLRAARLPDLAVIHECFSSHCVSLVACAGNNVTSEHALAS